jgi:UDP-N-acetylmuramyl pentapeptide phosphotransferase/UDP-N-acetylglucosamine-1-phosphate transferase/glycosyltransferase involved in cell wall biosynthesis
MSLQLLLFSGAAVSAVALTPVSMKVARLTGVVDKPNARKVHFRPTPRAGGLAIFTAILIAIIPALWHLCSTSDAAEVRNLGMALAACAGVFLIGLLDDFISIHRSQYKLIALLAATSVVYAAGFKLQTISLSAGYSINLGRFALPVTFLWIIGVTTAINFIDGLDGLAAGICTFTAAAIAMVAWKTDPVVAAIAVGIAGSLCGFLVFNFNPAKVFMGDCGSMFLGFTLATLSLMSVAHTPTTAGLAVPAACLGIPILDAVLTMIRRSVLQRRSLFAAERGHVHHRLIDQGLSHRTAVLVLYAVTLVCGGVAAAGWSSPNRTLQALSILAQPFMLISFFAMVGSLRIGDIGNAFRRNREMGKLTSQYRHIFDEMQLRFMAARSFNEWWVAVCECLNRLEFSSLSLPVTNRDGSIRTLNWQKKPSDHSPHTLRVSVPIRHRRVGGPLRAEVELSADGSLELAGRRVTVFARLMEENSLSSIRETKKEAAKSSTRPEAWPDDVPRMDSALSSGVKVAIVHDFLYTYAGAERVLEQMLNVFPEASLFSLFDFLPEQKRGFLRGRAVTTSFIQRMPMARKKHRHYLPLMPLAVEQLDVSAFDIVISSSYVAAKGILTRPDQLHVCYCHSPVRFAWDLQHQYLFECGMTRGLKSMLARAVLHYIRNWDTRSANGVDLFLTNSDFVARRVEKCYRRRSVTLYPPVDLEHFTLETEKEDFYLTVSRMVPYKRIDLIAEAFSAMPDKRLIIIGEGPDFEKIKAKSGPNVKLLGHLPFDQMVEYMQRARAFVFAAEEDFGIAPVEAQACGTPVIAFGRGGVTESVIAGVTGVFFNEQTVAKVCEAVRQFEQNQASFNPATIRAHAAKFNTVRFREAFLKLVEDEWMAFNSASDRMPSNDQMSLSNTLAVQSRRLRDRVTALEADLVTDTVARGRRVHA